MTRLSSSAYLAGSKGQACTLRIPGVCNNDPTTVVPAHIRDGWKGMGNKASDLSVANACSKCHAKMDGQLGLPLSDLDWLAYALRGLQETLEQRVAAGLLGFPHDKPKARKVAQRKPRDQRAPLRSGKSIPSRPFPQRGKP